MGELLQSLTATWRIRRKSTLRDPAGEAIINQQTRLATSPILQNPLIKRLALGGETLKKLSFSVGRMADVERWADAG